MAATKQVKIECASKLAEKQPLVLVGFMGCGKSTLAEGLARLLGRQLVDLDQEIARANGKSIAAIFKAGGERGFRALETKQLKLGLKTGGVLAAGGGLVLRANNRKLLLRYKACIVWVDPGWDSLWDRLKKQRTGVRPLLIDSLTGKPRSERWIKDLWSARRQIYSEIATIRLRVGAGESASTSLRRFAEMLEL